MSCVKSNMWPLLIIVLLCSVNGKKICDFNNAECMTKGARSVFRSLMSGIEGLFEPTGTLYIEEVKGEIKPALKYTLRNATMSSINKCEVVQLRCDNQDLTFDYNVFCPQLFVNYDSELKGTLGSVNMDGDGHVKLILNDYLINVTGGYGYDISERDHKLRSTMTDYYIKTESKRKAIFEISNPIGGDKEKSNQAEDYFNENWMVMETYLRPFIEAFLKQYMDRIQIVLKTFPAEDLFFED